MGIFYILLLISFEKYTNVPFNIFHLLLKGFDAYSKIYISRYMFLPQDYLANYLEAEMLGVN